MVMRSLVLMMGLWAGALASAQPYDDRASVQPVTDRLDYELRTAEIPMRDGVTLHTVIIVPRGAENAPMLVTRTPYSADGMAAHADSSDMASILAGFDNTPELVAEGGYIRVIQDIRGRFGSEGTFVTARPLARTALNPTEVDESTDAYDTFDWLVKNVPESNGRVGMIGVSYDGFEVLMALVDAHPALKVAVPINPMVDGWKGDDWFHNGAFRQMMIPAIWGSTAADSSVPFYWDHYDLYDAFMQAGSAGAFARMHGLLQAPAWQKITDHPAYDEFWQEQAVDRMLASEEIDVPVMLVHSLFDQEDIYGAPAVYRALEPGDEGNDRVYLTIGPWSHGQSIESRTDSLGPVSWDQDTARWWRKSVLGPFLAHYLKDEPMDVAPVTAFRTGTNEWQRLERWPASDNSARLFLKPGLELGFEQASGPEKTEAYVSDPSRPVTIWPRPIRFDDNWPAFLVSDQRHAASRPDVLTFVSGVLSDPVAVSGPPLVNLTAATSGTDSDWVVKVIDVYPDQMASDPEMAGYQLPVAMDIFRGRYRASLETAAPLEPGALLNYRFHLPDTNHVFRPGHRIMVQVQSSWFPLYDRNPQSFVPSIFDAGPADYQTARQEIAVSGPRASYVELPLAGD